MASSSAVWLGARPSSSLRKGAGQRKLLGSGPQHNGKRWADSPSASQRRGLLAILVEFQRQHHRVQLC